MVLLYITKTNETSENVLMLAAWIQLFNKHIRYRHLLCHLPRKTIYRAISTWVVYCSVLHFNRAPTFPSSVGSAY